MSLIFPLREDPPVRLAPGVARYGQDGFARDDTPIPEPLVRRPASPGQPLQ
jgi:hypothetical protein